MANANPVDAAKSEETKESKSKPEIQYFGEGADKVKFKVDEKAKLIRVYADGLILVDY